MKKILSILLVSLAILSSYAQTEAGFLKDAKNNFVKVGTSSTEFRWSAFPPDTIIDFEVNDGGVSGTFTSLLTEIKSYWTLEEAAGNAVDSVGTADLPVYGTVTRQQTGISDYCYSFATDGYLGDIDTYYEFSGSFSLQCWINTTAGGTWTGILTNYGAYEYGWELISNGDPTRVIYWRMRYASGSATIAGTTDINDGAWHHLIASYNAVDDTMKLWIDGDLEDKILNTNGTAYSVDARFQVGARKAFFFNGKIDEIAAWNRELTPNEVDSLYDSGVGKQYPFLGEGSGGDSLRMINNGFDPRGDSVRVIVNPLGEGRSTSRTDGILLFAFNMADSADYKDTTFFWPYLKDTTYIIEAYTGLWPEDVWTVDPNYDTVFVDSSDIYPPPQDYPAIWDTIFYQDFEQHSGIAPVEYTFDLQSPDWNDCPWFDSDHRWGAGWAANPNIKDSVIIDPISESNVLRWSFDDTIIDGYDGQGSGRGGGGFLMDLGAEPKEVYFSYNIMFRPGFLPSGGGKIPGLAGGDWDHDQTLPEYGDGFKANLIWDWTPQHYRSLGFYVSYQDMPGPYGQYFPFRDFQPEADGLQYTADNWFYLDVTDLTWVNITLRYVVNTFNGETPIKNGILEAFVNGYLLEQVSGLYLITYPDRDLGVDKMLFRSMFGGGGPPLRDEWILIDDVIVFIYDEEVDVPRGNELSPPGRVLNLPNWPKPVQE